MAKPQAPGEHILLVGNYPAGRQRLVRDSFLEFWQANHEGVYGKAFDSEKSFQQLRPHRDDVRFRWLDPGETIKPGVVKNAAGVPMAPHINVSLFARGINIHLQPGCHFL